MKLNHTSGIPLYVQIRERLRTEMGLIKPGEPIPPECELEKRFNVSRITIRRAVEDLASEGLLIRQRGRGTFVQHPKLTHELSTITSWTQQIRALGFTPKTVHRKVVDEEAPSHVSEVLRLAPAEKVIRIQRVRLANREPISYMTNYVPSRLMPGFSAAKFKGESLYEVMQQDYGLVPAIAVDTVGTRPAFNEEADALHIERRAPVLSVRRVGYLKDGSPLELAIVASRADRYQYQVALHGKSHEAPSPLFGGELLFSGSDS